MRQQYGLMMMRMVSKSKPIGLLSSLLLRHPQIRCIRHLSVSNKMNKMSDKSFIKPYNHPHWAKSLKNIPKVKVELANGNTPIHKWNLPRVAEGFKLSIKRDDMTGSTLSGNKVRKLEFLMADALSQGCQHVVTCGGIQSNHCRAVAVAARQLGMKPHLVLRTDIQDAAEVGCEGNLLLDRLCGADIYLVPLRSPYLTELLPRMNQIVQNIWETKGEKCYPIPVGGSNEVGLFGYLTMIQELEAQGALEEFDDLVFACGSGGTAAGLAIGNYLTGNKLRIHGIAVSDDSKYFHAHCNEMLSNMGLKVQSEDILDIIDGHKGRGYGLSTQEELDFLTEVSLQTGIMLDPVYTGKAVKGLVHELQHNPDMFKGHRVLYLHTGGVFGLYDGRINAALKNSQATNAIYLWPDKTASPV